MKEIDWSKAPEGTTHAWANDSVVCWYRVEDPVFYSVYDRDFRHGDVFQQTPSSHKDLIKRPTAWNGEGLPPVGTVCEWLSEQYGWLGGKVVGHDGTVTVVAHNDGYTGCHPHEIRPIRTPEQIAAEERKSHVLGMLCYDALGTSRRGLAEALYDAGYRKVKP